MVRLTWTITLIAVLITSSQSARSKCRNVNIQDTPIQGRTARPFQPLPYELERNLYRHLTIVPQEAVIFRESHHNTPYPAIMIMNKRQCNRSVCFDVSVFDIRNIPAKTWQPFQREINLEQILGGVCSGPSWPNTLTVSPSKQHIVMYGFGTGQCAEKLVIYGDRRLRVITATGGHAAMGAALATMAVGESDNSTFDLFAFGGAECLDRRNVSCIAFSNSLRILRIESSETCLNCSWQNWKVLDIGKGTAVPAPRAYADVFADGSSILLFGGVTPPSSLDSGSVNFLPDLWRYGLVSEEWVQLESNIDIDSSHVFDPSTIKTVQAAFLADEGTLIVLYGSSIYFCSICPTKARCNEHKYNPRWLTYYPSAAQSVFHFFNGFTNTKVEFLRIGVGESKKIRPTIKQIEQETIAECPAFQGHFSIPAIFVPHDDHRRHQYLFFSPAYSTDEKWWLDQDKAPAMSIWSLQYANRYEEDTYPFDRFEEDTASRDRYGKVKSANDYMYIHTFNSPAPSHCTSVTYLNPSTALLHERRSQTWCLSIPTYSWTLATTSTSHVPPYRTDNVAFKYRSGMVLYGGISPGLHPVVLGDLWLFQLQEGNNCTGSWHDLTPYVIEGYLPKRYLHAVTEYGDGVIVIGGNNQHPRFTPNLGKNTMFMLQIKSNTHVVVRNIEIVPSIPNRICHTLSLYTKTELLLLGGTKYFRRSNGFAEEALLMTVEEQNQTILATWTVFFKFNISQHTILNNRIFSGVDSVRRKTRQFYAINNTNQCPKGYQRDGNNSCRPCPIGYYSATIQQQCEKCGNLTTTMSEGSTACEPRNPCTGGYCHGHGTCFVNTADYKPFCTCQFGYVASDRCKVPSVYLALMAAVVFATTATILVIALYQFVRKRRALNATEIQLGNTNRDLQRHQKKLQRINMGTLVCWSDLTIGDQLASGTYSKVLLAELGDMTVVVKQLPSYFITGSLSSPYDIFIQEAEILRGLRHPNIVMFLGAGKDASSGCPFLVMEYLRRGSLHDVLHDLSNPIEHCDRLRFALDAARGLKYLHSSSPPQIHRDIKSPNLLVSDKWVVKVGDLETARFLATYQSEVTEVTDNNAEKPSQLGDTSGRARQHSVSYNSASNQLTTPLLANSSKCGNPIVDVDVTSRVGMTCGAGTDRWRSPESIKKNLYTEKHDVYSFGVVLWEIFTRQTPYSDFTSSEDILDEIVNERKPIFPPSAPYAYRHLAEQCMNTDAVDRPSIQRVVKELTEQIENC